MSEYYFDHYNSTRQAILEEFNAMSHALNCVDDFKFTFETDDLESFKQLLSFVNDSKEFDISVEGMIDLSSSLKLTNYESIFSKNNLRLFNLTIDNQSKYEGDTDDEWMRELEIPFITISLIGQNRYPLPQLDIRIQDKPKKTKSKRKHLEKIEFRVELFNSWFEALEINAKAVTGISDGSDYMWPKNSPGVIIESNNKTLLSDLEKSVTNDELGCNWLTFHPKNHNKLIGTIEKLLNLDFFTKRSGTITLWGKSAEIQHVLEIDKIPFDNISNVISEEITADDSLLEAFNKIKRFEGDITLLRAYSFNNSVCDILGLRLDQDELYSFVEAGMVSKNTISKFLNKLSIDLNKEINFEK